MDLFKDSSVKNLFNRYIGVEKIYKIVYQGKGISLNDYYSAGHWSKRHNLKKKYNPIFEELIENAGVAELNQFSLIIAYNSRHDVDNVTGLEKIFMDTLKNMRVKEDDKRYYRGFMVFPDETLETNTFEFYLIPHAE